MNVAAQIEVEVVETQRERPSTHQKKPFERPAKRVEPKERLRNVLAL